MMLKKDLLVVGTGEIMLQQLAFIQRLILKKRYGSLLTPLDFSTGGFSFVTVHAHTENFCLFICFPGDF